MAPTRKPSSEGVVVVSANRDTLETLCTYLRGAGVATSCAPELSGCAKAAGTSTLAYVLFADDFGREEVVATLADLAVQQPTALPVLVTAHPQHFERLRSPEKVLIVPRPVWGWTILDAIRAHRERSGPTTENGHRARR
jgi:hypothetical protein